MTFPEWKKEKLKEKQPCKIVETMSCRPDRNDSYCDKCYKEEMIFRKIDN
jgi:hypothetical protein